jgi:hypothetical protein
MEQLMKLNLEVDMNKPCHKIEMSIVEEEMMIVVHPLHQQLCLDMKYTNVLLIFTL